MRRVVDEGALERVRQLLGVRRGAHLPRRAASFSRRRVLAALRELPRSLELLLEERPAAPRRSRGLPAPGTSGGRATPPRPCGTAPGSRSPATPPPLPRPDSGTRGSAGCTPPPARSPLRPARSGLPGLEGDGHELAVLDRLDLQVVEELVDHAARARPTLPAGRSCPPPAPPPAAAPRTRGRPAGSASRPRGGRGAGSAGGGTGSGRSCPRRRRRGRSSRSRGCWGCRARSGPAQWPGRRAGRRGGARPPPPRPRRTRRAPASGAAARRASSRAGAAVHRLGAHFGGGSRTSRLGAS